MPQIYERFLRRVALANVQLVEVELQPIEIEADFADAHLAMNTRGDRPGHDMTQHRRHREVGRHSEECDDRDDDHADFASPARPCQLPGARGPRTQVLARSLQVLEQSLVEVTHGSYS